MYWLQWQLYYDAIVQVQWWASVPAAVHVSHDQQTAGVQDVRVQD